MFGSPSLDELSEQFDPATLSSGSRCLCRSGCSQQSIKQVSTRQQRLPTCESENASKLENFFVGPPCHWLSLSPPHLPGRSAEGKFWMRTTPDVGSTIFPCVVNHFTTGCVAHKVKCCAHLEFPSAEKMTKGQESGDDGSTCTCGASCVGWNRHLLAWLWLIPWPGPSHGPWGPPPVTSAQNSALHVGSPNPSTPSSQLGPDGPRPSPNQEPNLVNWLCYGTERNKEVRVCVHRIIWRNCLRWTQILNKQPPTFS